MQILTRPFAQLHTLSQHWRNLRRSRAYLVALIAILTTLSATVAIGQSSDSFDLACRSIISAGNQTMTNSGASFGVIGTLGLPMVPPKDSDTNPTYTIRNATHGVRAGFLPGYPNGQRVAIAEEIIDGSNSEAALATVDATGSAPTIIDQSHQQRLPLIFKVVRVIRGGC